MATENTTTQNVFDLFARLLFVMRHSLEDLEERGRPPRWVRIARTRVAADPPYFLGVAVKGGAKGFVEGMSFSAEIALNLHEILLQTDATEAFIEVGWEFLKGGPKLVEDGAKLFEKQFPLPELKGFSTEEFQKGMDQAGLAIEGVMNLIPSPEDAASLGHELYRMLCVEQIEVVANKDTKEHFNIATTGKARLMQWAFGLDSQVWIKAKPEALSEPVALSRLGSRCLWKADSNDQLPSKSIVSWEIGGKKEELIDFSFQGADVAKDIEEINAILDKLNYKPIPADNKQFGGELTKRLCSFQAFNDLPITSKLDNPTLNRLMNLDYSSKNVLRAKPYNENQPEIIRSAETNVAGTLDLVNPMADHPEEEGLELIQRGGYAYYAYDLAGHVAEGKTGDPVKLPKGGGWISDRADGAIAGFVALQSRSLDKDKKYFDGGLFSEGESASGNMFFAARIVEPWKAGRTGGPSDGALFGPHKPEGLPKDSVSRLYQWVKLKDPPTSKPDFDLFVRASVLQRSLWSDRNKITKMPDQGRLIVELYDKEVFQGDLGTRRPPDNKHKGREETKWFPEQVNTVTAELSLDEVTRSRNWTRRVTEWLKVPDTATGVLVALEGRYQSGWDIDAYFDNVELFYEFREPPAKQ